MGASRTGSPGRTGERVRPAGASRSEAPGRRGSGSGIRGAGALARVSAPTRRLAVLGAVVILLALMLVPTVRAFYEQRQEIAAMQDKVAGQEQSVQTLQQQKDRWKDPAYVEAQARQRLKFVKPGEVAYTVIGADAVAKAQEGEVHGSVVAPADADQMAWYSQLWTSIQLTDGLGRGTTRLDGHAVPAPTMTATTLPSQTASPAQSVPGVGGVSGSGGGGASGASGGAAATGTSGVSGGNSGTTGAGTAGTSGTGQ